jgi:short-subunit dehydrogenase
MSVLRARTLLAAAGAAAALSRLRPRPEPDDISGEVAIVTGASRGLGLLLARELARQGCPLVICARDQGELDRAAASLREDGAEVTAIACDVTSAAAPQRLVNTALDRYGRLDIVVSCAGLIQVGPARMAGAADYDEAWQTMAFAPIRLALAALPVMREQGHGRIATIASIGGKMSVPHLLPYSTAKFAVTGFSEGLRAELGPGPVTVTTVVPGLMRTGSHVRASFTGRQDEEFTWFSLGASLPLVSMDAERAAAQIVTAIRRRQAEIILTPAGQLVARAAAIMPGLTSSVLHSVQELALPPATDGNAQPAEGRQLSPSISPAVFGWLTTLGRAAARRFNQRKPDPATRTEPRAKSPA